MKELGLRWLKFNFAGALGIGVQLVLLTAFVQWTHYLAATVLAVEGAILHNFAWHEKLTWRERTSAVPGAMLKRLLRFHLANGFVSLLGNIVLMRVFVGSFGLPLVPANLLSIACCGLINFVLSELFVFPMPKRRYPEDTERLFI
jgi:putative flippase GtrA